MLGEAEGIRLDTAAARERLRELGGSIGLDVDPGATTGTPRARPAAAARDHQGALARLEGADPRRADLDAHAAGRRRAGADPRPAQGAGAGRRLHHPQAARGDLDRRSRLGAQPGPPRRRDRAGRAALGDATRSSRSGSSRSCSASRRGTPPTWPSSRTRSTRHVPRTSCDAEPALELEGVTVEPGPGEIGAYDVSLQVLKGEIMGIAGVDGNGQRELAEAIAGQRSLARGDVRLFGHSLGEAQGRAAREARASLRHRRPSRTRARSARCRWR